MLSIATRLACCATTSAANEPLTVVSLNMAGETDIYRVMRYIDRIPEVIKVDLFLLQEVAGAPDGSSSIAKDMAGRLGIAHYLFKAADPIGGGRMKGLAILSRYPFHDSQVMQLKHIGLHFKSRDRIALAVTLDNPGGPIRVFDVHLDSRINKEQRLEQLAPVVEAARKDASPCLIGGDFNTGHVLWVSHIVPLYKRQDQAEALRSWMQSQGFSTPFGDEVTFPLFHQRLDWIFLRALTPVARGVVDIPFSDHNAIWVKVSPAG